MKKYDKSYYAGVAVLIISILAAILLGQARKPISADVSMADGLNTSLDTSYYEKFLRDDAGVLSEEQEEANRLTIVGALIQNAVVRANRYLEALKNRRYVEGTNVLDEEAFAQLVKAFSDAREKGLTEYTLLEVLAGGEDYEKVAIALGSAIRQTDYLGILKGGRLYALLSNTGRENVGGIMERFQNAGYDSRLEEAVV